MAIVIKQSTTAWSDLASEDYYASLLTRAIGVIRVDDRRAHRRFYGYVDGLLKASGYSTKELRINRQIRQLVTLVNKSIEAGKIDPTLRTLLDENKLPISD